MRLTVGERLHCEGCAAEVIVIRAPVDEVGVTCGGHGLISGARTSPAPTGEDDAAGMLLGKRYADADAGLELLCTHGGAGALELDGTALAIKDAKSLPSSD